MLCSRCHAVSPSNHRFCDTCGASLQPICETCGHTNRSDARFCGGCGRALVKDAEQIAAGAGSDRWTALPARLAALLSSRFAREGERKQVTVLFADIRGSTQLIEELDPEHALQRLEPALQAMAQEVQRYGGTVNRMHGDGIMALFGAPLACEDHAVRGCLAARSMIDAVAALKDEKVEVRVGLNSGAVVVRSIGYDMSMEYDAAGSTTHLAKRMEQLATPGTALATSYTATLAAGFIHTRLQGLVNLKGVSRPVEVFELTGVARQSRWQVRAASHSLSEFVGRGTDLRVLLDALQRAMGGRGQIVAVTGDAGLGKSRLAHEFLHDAMMGGIPVLRAAAVHHDRTTAYHMISEMLRSWLGVDSQDTIPEIEDKLVGAMGTLEHRQDSDLAAIRSLLDLPSQGDNWQTLDAQQRRQRIHQAVRSLIFQIASRAPHVVVLEDMHWADIESQSLLDFVIDGLGDARLLVVATYRPEYENRWARRSSYSLIQLAPLDIHASDALLRGLIGDSPDLSRLREKLIEQADGTPLFLEEMARMLVETGVLVNEAPRFRLTRSVDDVEIPASVSIILASRVDRLPAPERSLLQIASVFGREVPVRSLAAVALAAASDVPQDQLGRLLADLCHHEFLHEVNGSFGTEYTFKHALTHDVAYDSMLIRHRRLLHGQVLRVIEEQFAARIDEFTERLADHATRAEIRDKAVHYCLKAGQRANNRSAHGAAKSFFARALASIDPAATDAQTVSAAIEIRLGLRVALAATGDLADIRQYLIEAEELAQSLGDERRMMPIVISRSTILTNLGDLPGSIRAGSRGRLLAEQLADQACLVSSGFALGQAYWNSGDFAQAERVLTDTVGSLDGDWGKGYGGTTGTASVLCLVALAHTHSFAGAPSRALARCHQAMAIALQTQRPYDLSYCHTAEGLAKLTAGNVVAAIPHLEEALKIARDHDILLLMPHAARYLGRAYALAGRLTEARTVLVEAIDQATAKSLAPLRGWCAAALGLTQMLAGATVEAQVNVASARDFAAAHNYRPLEVHASRLLGLISAEGSAEPATVKRAESWFGVASRLGQTIGMRPELAECHRGLANLFARSERPHDARKELAQAIALYRDSEMPGHMAEAQAALAALSPGGGGQ